MMKKNGFTLAEVLITLSIIGVVATMTLPALMANTQEQQAKTGLKKAINTLTEAAQMNQAIEGWDYGTATDANDASIAMNTEFVSKNFVSLLGNRTNIDMRATVGATVPSTLTSVATGNVPDIAVHLKDGSAIYFNSGNAMANPTNAVRQDDGLSLGYVVFYDTNGKTGPNILSNCSGNNAGAYEKTDSYQTFVTPEGATEACATKKNRVIKDIFAIRLRDTVAQPEGNAATWAYNGDVKSSTGGGGNTTPGNGGGDT